MQTAETKSLSGEPVSEFLSSILNHRITLVLPSEAEWEKSARGSDVRIYPWGNTFDPEFANVDMNIGSTSSAGCFPKGLSPFGISDCCGNVWEWTRTLWGETRDCSSYQYPYNREDGRENMDASYYTYRILRGGSFGNYHNGARCSAKLRDRPNFSGIYYGFRVAAKYE